MSDQDLQLLKEQMMGFTYPLEIQGWKGPKIGLLRELEKAFIPAAKSAMLEAVFE